MRHETVTRRPAAPARSRIALVAASLSMLTACSGLTPGSGTLRPDGAVPTVESTTAGSVPASTALDSTVPADTTTPDTAAGDSAESPDTTAPVDTSIAPGTAAPSTATSVPGDDAEDEPAPVLRWAVILGLIIALVVLGWAAGRARRPSAPVAPVAPVWTDHLRVGYESARWLRDALTDEFAIARGDQLVGPDRPSGASGDVELRWHEVERQIERARDALGRAEREVTDPTVATAIGGAVDALGETRAAVAARVEARINASANPDDPGAAERERIEATRLAEARARLDRGLTTIRGML